MDGVGYFPRGVEVRKNFANTWLDLPYATLTEPYTINKKGVQELLDFMFVQCDEDKKLFEWFKTWIALMIQRPSYKLEVCPLFCGRKGGGKTTTCDILEKLVGEENYYSTDKPEQHVWGKFNELVMGKKLICLEEFSAKAYKANDDNVKVFLTGSKITIEGKRKTPFEIKNYTACVATTNASDPIAINKDERRFKLIRANGKYVGDFEFFIRIRKLMSDTNVMRGLFDYFNTMKNLPAVLPKAPVTDYEEEMKENNKDPLELFLIIYGRRMKIANEENKWLTTMDVMDEFKMYLDAHNFKWEINTRSLGKKISVLVADGLFKGIDAKKTSVSRGWTLNSKALMSNDTD
jgi:hypothetical protein